MQDPSIENALRKAVGFYEQGRPDLAEAPCAQVLRRRPNDPDALHLLGTIRGQQGRFAEAAELLIRAVAADPRRSEAHRMLGIALFSLGQHEQALASFARAVAERPDHIAALANLGDAQRKLGRHAEALATYDRALALRPGDPEVLSGRGVASCSPLTRNDAIVRSSSMTRRRIGRFYLGRSLPSWSWDRALAGF